MVAALWLGMFLATLRLEANTYFIATNGSDAWSGKTNVFVSGTNGPWATFAHVNYGAKPGLLPGDMLYVGGGIYYHTNDGLTNCIRFISLYGTSNSPIVISNYPGQTPIIYGSGPNNYAIGIQRVAWLKLFGINTTNAYRETCIQWATNCEIAYCDFGGGDTNYGGLNPLTLYNNCQYNWIHNNTVHDAPATNIGDSTHNLTLGSFYSTNDFTAYNIVESNICYHSGHDTLSCYGPSNVLRYNWVHNEVEESNGVPYQHFRSDFMQYCGERDVELGGTLGNYNLFEHNWLAHAGVVGDAGSHGLEGSDAAHEIIRYNNFVNNDYSGLVIYGGKVTGTVSCSNYIYNNTIAYNGFGQQYFSNYLSTNGTIMTNPVSIINNAEWKYSVLLVTTFSNIFVNNLLWGNYSNYVALLNKSTNMLLFQNNLTNVNPLFANTNDGGPWQCALPNCSLPFNSPAVDAGAFLTAVTSPSGSGTSFTVADANYFFAGLTAATRTLPGDSIQLQGTTSTSAITAISGNTITVATPLTWTNGQRLSLSYGGSAPDVGAYEYYPPSILPPSNLRIITALP